MKFASASVTSLTLGGVALVALSLLDLFGIVPALGTRALPLLAGALLFVMAWERTRPAPAVTLDTVQAGLDRLQAQVNQFTALASAAPAGTASSSAQQPEGANGSSSQNGGRTLKWKGLTFHSQSEIHLARELDRVGVMFIAGARVRLKSNNNRQSREVDFLICHEGRWGVLEVDGPYHQPEADSWRDAKLAEHGIRCIRRYKANLAYNEPAEVVRDFLLALEQSADPLPVVPPVVPTADAEQPAKPVSQSKIPTQPVRLPSPELLAELERSGAPPPTFRKPPAVTPPMIPSTPPAPPAGGVVNADVEPTLIHSADFDIDDTQPNPPVNPTRASTPPYRPRGERPASRPERRHPTRRRRS